MPAKGISASLEKKIKKTSAGLEDLFKSFSDFLSATLEKASPEGKAARKPRKAKAAKAKASSKKAAKGAKAKAGKRGRRAGGGLREAIVEVCKSAGGPLTEAEIAKRLLESQDKYKWNKNESTLYQTLRKAVYLNLLSDSGRDKSTKTYQVA